MNDNNLIPFNERTASEQREISRKGGKASGEARRERKLIREALEERFDANDMNEVCDKLIERAKNTARDFEVLRDTLGEKPADNINLNPVNVDKSLEEMEKFFAEHESEDK